MNGHSLNQYKFTYTFYINAHDPDEAEDYLIEEGPDWGAGPDSIEMVYENIDVCYEDDCPLDDM